MPLPNSGCSQDAISENIAYLIRNEGKDPDQAAAIAYDQCKGCMTEDEFRSILARIQGSKGYRTTKGSLIKSKTPDRFEGYLVRFGSPEDTDLDEEWFSDKTYFMLKNRYDIKGRPVNYQHMMDSNFGALNMAAFDYVDENDIGLFVEAQLNAREHYMDMLRELGRIKEVKFSQSQLEQKADLAVKTVQELITSVPLQMSMGADPAAFYVNDKTGHIDMCGIVHGALTPMPADDNQPLVRFKSAMGHILNLTDERQTFILGTGRKAKGEQSGDSADTIVPDSAVAPPGAELSRTIPTETDKPVTRKSKKEESGMELEELGEKILKQLEPILVELLEQSNLETDEKQEEELLEEMMEKAEGVLPEDEEELKQMTEEEVEEKVKANLASILPDAIKQHMEATAKAESERKSLVSGALKDFRDSVPATSYKRQRGGYSQQQAPKISVREQLKYAGLSAEQMALGLHLVYQTALKHKRRDLLKFQDFVDTGMVSEAYMVSMAHKLTDCVQNYSEPYKRRGVNDRAMAQDYHLMKSLMPWKADELDAVALTNQGAEWAFITYDTRLWERARYETLLFDKMVSRGMRTMDVDGKTMNVKLNTGSSTVYTSPEAQSLGADGRPEVVVQITPFATDEVAKDVKTHRLATAVTEELIEDSIIEIMGFLDSDAVTAMAESLENTIINGDTTASSSNINTSSTPATGIQTPDYIAWDGIRHNYLVDNTARGNGKGSALEATDYEDTLYLLDPTVATRLSKLLFVIDPYTASATRKLPEALTDDVNRKGGTFFTGTIPEICGIEVYTSGFLAKSLSTGYIHATTGNDYGSIICLYPEYWQYGRKRAVTVELDREPLTGSTVVVVSARHILAARGDNAASATFYITL